MATILDISLLESFDIVFVALLVWTFVFAVLRKTKILNTGEDVKLEAAIASAIAILFIFSDTAVQMVKFMLPWFAVAIIFFFFMILLFMLFGADAKSIKGVISGDGGDALRWVIIAVGLLIVMSAAGNILGQKFLGEGSPLDVQANTTGVATDNFQQNVWATLFHPKIIGLVVLFGILIFAVALLTV